MRSVAILIFAVSIALMSCSTKQDIGSADVSSIDTLPKLRTVSAFTGIDQNKASFDAGKMAGKVWIASFFFSRCGTVCPALNTVLAELQKDFSDSVSFVSLTSDPEYDTPEVMKEYAQQYNAKPGVWHFVTMPLDSMIRVASRDLGLVEPTAPDIHSTRFVLIDKAMTVRGFYDSADTADVSKLRSILRAL
ncbi:MAG: hypothetical protein RLZZ273_1610 [Bacteroidota bacterium]|jgi:protein SCO1/2